ncbi:hypothetical protein EVAR_66898_1 [Eumeta japonica]|uniref:Uncharacterized protein n=1 Tax=Eumeta variegata TaxID=151549 RepID=A0A4C2AFJ1_EUMVA|nr:hypothetical protein EVAR_66898_1 [Eumeta japonica]
MSGGSLFILPGDLSQIVGRQSKRTPRAAAVPARGGQRRSRCRFLSLDDAADECEKYVSAITTDERNKHIRDRLLGTEQVVYMEVYGAGAAVYTRAVPVDKCRGHEETAYLCVHASLAARAAGLTRAGVDAMLASGSLGNAFSSPRYSEASRVLFDLMLFPFHRSFNFDD